MGCASSPYLCWARRLVTQQLHIEPFTFGLLLLLLCSSVVFVLICAFMLCCQCMWQERDGGELSCKSSSLNSTKNCKSLSVKQVGEKNQLCAEKCAGKCGLLVPHSESFNRPPSIVAPLNSDSSSQPYRISNRLSLAGLLGQRRKRRELVSNSTLAHIDEFDSLTPLLLSPSDSSSGTCRAPNTGENDANREQELARNERRIENEKEECKLSTGAEGEEEEDRVSVRVKLLAKYKQEASRQDDSPPLMRRLFAPVGKTTIVPLTSSNTRRTPAPLGPPHRSCAGYPSLVKMDSSRAATLTNKSCETIPEEGDEATVGGSDVVGSRSTSGHGESSGNLNGHSSLGEHIYEKTTNNPSKHALPPTFHSKNSLAVLRNENNNESRSLPDQHTFSREGFLSLRCEAGSSYSHSESSSDAELGLVGMAAGNEGKDGEESPGLDDTLGSAVLGSGSFVLSFNLYPTPEEFSLQPSAAGASGVGNEEAGKFVPSNGGFSLLNVIEEAIEDASVSNSDQPRSVGQVVEKQVRAMNNSFTVATAMMASTMGKEGSAADRGIEKQYIPPDITAPGKAPFIPRSISEQMELMNL